VPRPELRQRAAAGQLPPRGSAQLEFEGYTAGDLSVVETDGKVTLTLDNGTQRGAVTILGHAGTFNASDCSFV
jgi:hypothetical protein